MSDPVANALRIAAPNDMGGIERSLIEALRQKAAAGNANAQAGVAQHDASMANPLWGSSTYLSQRQVNSLGEALQKVPLEVMFLSNFMGPKAPPPRVPNPIKAYHGSPHDFDKFDLSKIGTGEGAQAYGHGIYLAEHEPVAQSYRDALAPRNYDKPAIAARWALEEAGGDAAGAVQKLRDSMAWYEKNGGLSDAKRAELSDAIRHVETGTHKGRMYEVAIHATPDQFLDWDKPLSQQSETVRKALEPLGYKAPDKTAMRNFDDALAAALEGDANINLPPQPRDPVGERIIRDLHSKHGSSWLEPNKSGEFNASSRLNEAGIPGIRYLDQGSRGAGKGTHNYVVFSPEIIEILRKYGLLGPIAAGAVANSLGGDGNQ